ncbi:MAG: hypothetical protein JWL82_477, partial [Parcubacteria group bacterium]|nr:hypothetical protein [Parcubacteria group bacterium]
VFASPRNAESSVITALILFFILAPIASPLDALWTVLAAFVAVAGKYLIAVRRKHLFNPAAFSALVLTLLGSGMATWWVATPALLPATIVFGYLVVRKLRRFDLWFSFFLAALVVKMAISLFLGTPVLAGLLSWFISWPVVFFSTLMLTEPITMPATKNHRIVYGGIVGSLFSSSLGFAGIYATPHLSLLAGNLYSFFVSSKGRYRLKLVASERLSSSLEEYSFEADRKLAFKPGQYMEWTLGHRADARGTRRYFTISSAPEEALVRIGVRASSEPSSFKRQLASMARGTMLSASNVAGDFVLPRDATLPLLWVAGGVGITPFISMTRSLQARGETRDIVLVYLAAEPEAFAYGSVLAALPSLKSIRIARTGKADWNGLTGEVDGERFMELVPDYAEREVFISGPSGMVDTFIRVAHDLAIPSHKLHTDYFPGL